MTRLPKRLIEVDLPIKRISAHARREKSIRHGHISTLHIWWARRPLAACRAVICAALWPDPADELCPDVFRDTAQRLMLKWAREHWGLASDESRNRLARIGHKPELLDDNAELRRALLDFIADFANWDNSTVREYLDTSRVLTAYAHRSLNEPDFAPTEAEVEESTRNPESAIQNWAKPLVVDPFAGGGAIPLEALRVGADAFASDLNPVAVLLNKVVLEYIPKYGQRLADEVRKWGAWVKEEAEKELAEFYPRDPDGATPIAYLWARTIRCEGPDCGAEVPLIRSLWLAKKANRSAALQILPMPEAKRVDFRIIVKQGGGWLVQDDPKEKIAEPSFDGTVKRGSATCPCCGYTTPVAAVRQQLGSRRGGAADARLFAVATTRPTERGRFYRAPTPRDLQALARACEHLERRERESRGSAAGADLSLLPNEPISPNELRRISVPIYGMADWGSLFAPRQALTLATLAKLVREAGSTCEDSPPGIAVAVQSCLAAAVNRQADFTSSLCTWWSGGEKIQHTFCRQALGMVWDFVECNFLSASTGCWTGAYEWCAEVCEQGNFLPTAGHVDGSSATCHPLPNDSAAAVITDPPYYDAVPYAYLSDFFYVWLRRTVADVHPSLLHGPAVPKAEEIVVDRPHHLSQSTKDIRFYERELGKAFAESRRVLHPDGIGTIVFASKTTSSWEAILSAVVNAGWTICGSWPIDTEMANRVAAMGQARLASSVHLVCRPRENPDGSVRTDEVGDWREVLVELPGRIHEWMPRLAEEGVVGADAIFACLGPALEIFSRYSRVEKASGEQVSLRDYLEQVWAAVSQEALRMVFEGADASGFEEDARLTAMWLWTLGSGNGEGKGGTPEDDTAKTDDALTGSKKKASAGYPLEYDAARKIAQGLGAHLENLTSVVEVKGETARLLPVSDRTAYLFGKDQAEAPRRKARRRAVQRSLFEELDEVQEEDGQWGDKSVSKVGQTSLDRVHQSMILFAAGRSEAMRRFLVEDGVGRDGRFWTLAQALSALYPSGSDEKRWVDGILARKKGLGF